MSGRDANPPEGDQWYAVTYRAPAEMTVYVLAESPESARQRAEDCDYETSSEITFVRGARYTMKVRRAAAGSFQRDA